MHDVKAFEGYPNGKEYYPPPTPLEWGFKPKLRSESAQSNQTSRVSLAMVLNCFFIYPYVCPLLFLQS